MSNYGGVSDEDLNQKHQEVPVTENYTIPEDQEGEVNTLQIVQPHQENMLNNESAEPIVAGDQDKQVTVSTEEILGL